jgi:ribosomal-protein-alanine N-acetyltransferase
MMYGLTLILHERPGRRVQAAAMSVMERAFDPAYGEAWTAPQLSGLTAMSGCWLTLAQMDGATLGFALVRSIFDESELLLLAVDPAWRRHAIGSALLDHSVAAARSRNIKSMFLEVRADNPAVALYRKTGFEHVNTRHGYYRGDDGKLYDALSFRLEI